MVNIIHGADFHLDSPFDGLSPEKARQRRNEQRETVMAMAELAKERGADIVFLSGDLFDSDNAFYETTTMLREVFASMEAEIFIAPGNHDYYSPGSPYRSVVWPENVHIFSSGRIECVELPEKNCRVYGAAFTGPTIHRSILDGFRAEQDDMINLMVLHGDTAAVTDGYNPISSENIGESGLDYLALGHIHRFSGILCRGATDYAYPGCIEGRGFDELGDKGVIAGMVGKGRTELDFVPVCKRRYIDVSADYSALLKGTAEIPAESGDIVRITLTGERDGDTDRTMLEDMLGGRFFQLVLRDRTTRRRDVWEFVREDSLRGMFLRDMREMYDAAQEDKKELILLAARYGLAAMENGEEPQL